MYVYDVLYKILFMSGDLNVFAISKDKCSLNLCNFTRKKNNKISWLSLLGLTQASRMMLENCRLAIISHVYLRIE